MPRQAATIGSLPQAFEVVKEMQADGAERGEGCRPLGRQAPARIIEGRDHQGPYGRGGRRLARHPRRRRHARPAQRHLPTLPARRARRHRTQRAAYPSLLPDRGSEGLRKARPGDRPCHPGRRRAGALDLQGRRGPARSPGPGRDREPGRRDPRPVGRRLPPPAAHQRLQGGDARRPCPGGRSRWRRGSATTAGRRSSTSGAPAARVLPRPAVPPRPHRRGPRDDLSSMAARACSPPCRSSGTASPSGGAGRTGSATSSTGSASPTGRPS